MRKKFAVVMFALAMTITAHAAERAMLPAEMLGQWCLGGNESEQTTVFERGNCGSDKQTVVAFDGFRSPDVTCKVTRIRPMGHVEFVTKEVRLRCRNLYNSWSQTNTMWVDDKNRLFVHVVKAK